MWMGSTATQLEKESLYYLTTVETGCSSMQFLGPSVVYDHRDTS